MHKFQDTRASSPMMSLSAALPRIIFLPSPYRGEESEAKGRYPTTGAQTISYRSNIICDDI
jgi:hypothetical protein